jgi:hypothetical protein
VLSTCPDLLFLPVQRIVGCQIGGNNRFKIQQERDMRIQYAVGFYGIALTLLAPGFVRAQQPASMRISGVLNDYSPSTVPGGTWEIRGGWSLDVQTRSATANFTAALTMETSDYGILSTTQVDPTNPLTRTPHTHHITMTDAAVTYITTGCPANNPATAGSGVVVSGAVDITGNGSPAPFASKGPSTLQVCIIGGSEVEFSNVTLVFTGPATGHFGPQAIHGVVSQVTSSRSHQ